MEKNIETFCNICFRCIRINIRSFHVSINRSIWMNDNGLDKSVSLTHFHSVEKSMLKWFLAIWHGYTLLTILKRMRFKHKITHFNSIFLHFLQRDSFPFWSLYNYRFQWVHRIKCWKLTHKRNICPLQKKRNSNCSGQQVQFWQFEIYLCAVKESPYVAFVYTTYDPLISIWLVNNRKLLLNENCYSAAGDLVINLLTHTANRLFVFFQLISFYY